MIECREEMQYWGKIKAVKYIIFFLQRKRTDIFQKTVQYTIWQKCFEVTLKTFMMRTSCWTRRRRHQGIGPKLFCHCFAKVGFAAEFSHASSESYGGCYTEVNGRICSGNSLLYNPMGPSLFGLQGVMLHFNAWYWYSYDSHAFKPLHLSKFLHHQAAQGWIYLNEP